MSNGIQEESAENAPNFYTQNFRVIDIIGKGGFGKVYLIRRREVSENLLDEDFFAMKVIKIERILKSDKQVGYVMNEMKLLSKIDHPFIVKLFYAFKSPKHLYLIMELMSGGDMRSILDQRVLLTEVEVKFYVASIVLALTHLHSLNIIYRDLKPENIMFDMSGHIKIIDLGLCKITESSNDKTSTICGTIEYLAPEVVSRKPYDNLVDWWSLGILIYHMLVGTMPFTHSEKKKLINKILSQMPKIPCLLSSNATSVIKQLLHKKPEKRLGSSGTVVDGLKSHKFFRKIDFDAIYNGKVKSPFELEEAEELITRDQRLDTIRWSRLDGPTRLETNASDADTDQANAVTKINDRMDLLSNFGYVSPKVRIQPPGIVPRHTPIETLDSVRKSLNMEENLDKEIDLTPIV